MITESRRKGGSKMFKNCLATTIAVALLSVPGAVQSGETGRYVAVPEQQEEAASPQCSGGIVYDDGGFSNGYSIVLEATMVMKFELPVGTTSLDQVCVCFSRPSSQPENRNFDVVVYDDNGAGGQPGTLIASVPATASSLPVFPSNRFYSVDVSGSGIVLPDTSVYVGAHWPFGFHLCGDRSSTTSQRSIYGSSNQGASWTSSPPLFPTIEPRALGVRVDPRVPLAPPPVPSAPPLISSQYPDFRFWVRIGDTRIGTAVAGCLPETVCVAGAIPTRAEVFLRIVGPKPNGYLWPNIVKFNTTKTEVWIRQVSTGITKYYLLPALPTDSSTLPGLVDKTGFLP